MRSAARAVLLGLSMASLMLVSSLASGASIHRVSFTGNPTGGLWDVWVEEGVTAIGEISHHDTPDTVHLDPGGTPFGPSISFSTGSLFDALSIDIDSSGGLYCATTDPSECEGPPPNFPWIGDDPFPNVWITGFVDDRLVSTLSFSRPTIGGFETIPLGGAFSRIDRLAVTARYPEGLGQTGFCSVEYCGHFSIDNVVLRDVAAIPEPSAGILFALGLALVGRSLTRE